MKKRLLALTLVAGFSANLSPMGIYEAAAKSYLDSFLDSFVPADKTPGEQRRKDFQGKYFSFEACTAREKQASKKEHGELQ
ncbi:hypothetical protein HOD08_02625 [bacterium]|nr:hypothetical protein [bacterium]